MLTLLVCDTSAKVTVTPEEVLKLLVAEELAEAVAETVLMQARSQLLTSHFEAK